MRAVRPGGQPALRWRQCGVASGPDLDPGRAPARSRGDATRTAGAVAGLAEAARTYAWTSLWEAAWVSPGGRARRAQSRVGRHVTPVVVWCTRRPFKQTRENTALNNAPSVSF